MQPTSKTVKDLTMQTLKFELGGLIDNVIENVYILLEEDKDFDTNNMGTQEGDIIYHVVIDTVRSAITRADEYV